MKVVFLDRDGVINKERGDYTWNIHQFELVPGLVQALKELQGRGFQFIVITNQGGIAKGIYSHHDVIKLHAFMQVLLAEEGIKLLDIFYSPYHDNFSKSLSRKPDSLMLERAIALHGVEKDQSYMIGDSDRDIIAARKAGIKGIKVEPNQNINEILDQIHG